MKVVLISCVAKKRNCASLAKDLYVSPLFKGAYRYAQKLDADIIYILSAKYGLLNCNDFVQPYNETLNTKPLKEVQQWAKEVYCQLCKVADPKTDEFVFLAGERYRKYLLPLLKNVSVPLQGMGIGKQLAFYKENARCRVCAESCMKFCGKAGAIVLATAFPICPKTACMFCLKRAKAGTVGTE